MSQTTNFTVAKCRRGLFRRRPVLLNAGGRKRHVVRYDRVWDGAGRHFHPLPDLRRQLTSVRFNDSGKRIKPDDGGDPVRPPFLIPVGIEHGRFYSHLTVPTDVVGLPATLVSAERWLPIDTL